MLSSKSSCTLLSPWLPNYKAQKVQNKHRCFCKGAEEWFVVLSKNILWRKKLQKLWDKPYYSFPIKYSYYMIFNSRSSFGRERSKGIIKIFWIHFWILYLPCIQRIIFPKQSSNNLQKNFCSIFTENLLCNSIYTSS